HAPGLDHARVFAAVVMREVACEDEGYRLEAAMRVRPERQSVVTGRIDLRPVMVEEQERIDLRKVRPGHRPPRHEVGNVVALGRVNGSDGAHSPEVFTPCRASKAGRCPLASVCLLTSARPDTKCP